MFARLSGEPAHFGIRSLRHATSLGIVRDELEAALGVRFESDLEDGDQVFLCEVPASGLRLNAWAEATTWRVFNFIGAPVKLDPHVASPHGNDISELLAGELRKAGHDWYVPSKNEFLEEAGVLKDGLVDTEALVSFLAPRWLSWASPAERASGLKLLEGIATEWLAAALRTSDPGRYLRRRTNELQERYPEPSARLRVLASYLSQR